MYYFFVSESNCLITENTGWWVLRPAHVINTRPSSNKHRVVEKLTCPICLKFVRCRCARPQSAQSVENYWMNWFLELLLSSEHWAIVSSQLASAENEFHEIPTRYWLAVVLQSKRRRWYETDVCRSTVTRLCTWLLVCTVLRWEDYWLNMAPTSTHRTYDDNCSCHLRDTLDAVCCITVDCIALHWLMHTDEERTQSTAVWCLGPGGDGRTTWSTTDRHQNSMREREREERWVDKERGREQYRDEGSGNRIEIESMLYNAGCNFHCWCL